MKKYGKLTIIKKMFLHAMTWWKGALDNTVYPLLRKSDWIWPKYRIDGCNTYSQRALVECKNPFLLNGNMQDFHDHFLQKISFKLKNKQKYSVIRLGDGEALFLRNIRVGNISKRHLTEKTQIDIEAWKKKTFENDLITNSYVWSLRKLWTYLFPNIKKQYFPLEVIYASIANKELFKCIGSYKIGVIGSQTKMSIIENLMTSQEYRKYLNLTNIEQYISVPQVGACNNTNDLMRNILTQMNNKYCDIYLVGIGIAKLELLSQLRDYTNAVFVDIGSGIDALAGIIPNDRPYFGNWLNYRNKNIELLDFEIDYLSQFNHDVETKIKEIDICVE